MAALAGGTRLGPYEILAPIGAGGMGEVYRGRDTRLDRVVAIKVLAAGLATDITSRERFDREARAISSLNHPNICVLHDVGRERPSGTEAPVDFLVMEFLEGETLAARLSRGRAAKTLQETLSMAIAIAAALDCAHRQGIVHRDLKPGNVMLLGNGTVKLLDFGLARLSQSGAESAGKEHAGMVSLADLSQPTVSSPLTVKGTILGTLQYMAPEQLEGKPVDVRADIFAFGGMLYEMLTGKRPFEGKSQASLIGAILDHHPPPVSSLQPLTPPILDDTVARCLEKNPDDRWQSARDLKRQLEWVAGRPQDSSGTIAGAVPPAGRRSRFHGLQLAAAVLAGAIITAAAAAWMMRPALPPPPLTTRFVIQLPEDQIFTRPGRHLLNLSPDGSQLVYVANQQLNLRPMNALTAAPIRGTEGTNPAEPVFSPDGQWIAFWSDDAIKKVSVSGGTPITLCASPNPLGLSWSGDRILIGSMEPRGIVAVSSSGGQTETLVTLDEKRGEYAQSPSLIDNGRAVLFSLRTSPDAWDVGPIVVQQLASGQRKVLVTGGTDPRLLPTGHVVFTRRATLFAVPVDTARLEATGPDVPVLEGVRQAPSAASGAAQWVWSPSGSAAFIPGEESASDRALVWVDRKGSEERAPAPFRRYEFGGTGLRISPDGSQVALVIVSETRVADAVKTGSDIWIWHVARNTLSRLTVTTLAASPVWTADSRRVCYRSESTVFCQAADGTGQPVKMFTAPEAGALKAIDASASRFLFNTTTQDIAVATVGAQPDVRPLIKTAFNDANAALSPDGLWIAYVSNESGSSQVYVRPFPAVDNGRWQVSSAGGFEPRWSRDGKELFFVSGGAGTMEIWRVAVQAGATFDFEPPIRVGRFSNDPSNAYDVGVDGRFLMHGPPGVLVGTEGGGRQIVVIHNWREEFLARVRSGGK